MQTGVYNNSEIFFCSASKLAKELLFYPIVSGISYCNKDLMVKRDHYDSSLLIFVLNGEFILEQDGIYNARENDLLIVDCYRKHSYYCKQDATTVWVHFMGSNSRLIVDKILKDLVHHVTDEKYKYEMLDLYKYIKNGEDEILISNKIYSILTSLLESKTMPTHKDQIRKYIESVKNYINRNYQKHIAISDMANSVNISSSYLFSIFKKYELKSPYDYLLEIRLRKAETLLRESDLSISEIGYQVGFNSDANFIYFFKKEVGISPLKFRKISY